MEIISYLNASLQKFISNDEFLPERQSSFAPFAQAIAIRYHFQSRGELPDSAANVGAPSPIFQNGFFTFNNKNAPALSLDFSPSRIASVSSTSEQARGLLDDVISYLRSEFNFRIPNRNVLEFETSAVVVDFGLDFFSKIASIRAIQDLLDTNLTNFYKTAKMEAQSVKFNGSVSAGSFTLGAQYVLEERAGRPPGTSWVFSQAPLPTNHHVAMLESLERLLSRELHND